jgi:hypothetical protein
MENYMANISKDLKPTLKNSKYNALPIEENTSA